jgi:[ribosomal protein S5]-alanine N-acetyltransferase
VAFLGFLGFLGSSDRDCFRAALSFYPSRMTVFETERLSIRRLTFDDAEFIQELVNEPSFLKNIGDRNVKNRTDAERYLTDGPLASYEKNGFGLFAVVLKETSEAIGMCGLIRRDTLPDVDIGYAFLPRFWSKGYALESTTAMMQYGRETHGLDRIVAIVDPSNAPSIKVLEKIGLKFGGMLDVPDGRPTALYVPAQD